MIGRTARLLGTVLPLAVATALLGPAPAQADVVFDVPEAPSGVATVTAVVAPTDFPFLAVAINALDSYDATTAGVTPVVATADGTTSINVETWGLGGRAAFTLLGCA